MNDRQPAEKVFTMYVTKWWATKGIVRLNGHVVVGGAGEGGPTYFSSGNHVFVRIGSHAFYGLDQAHEYVKKKAKKKAKKKQASLLKQAAAMAKAAQNSVDVVYGL